MKRIFCLLAVLFCTFLLLDVSAQGEYATPKSGEGISSFLERNKRPGKAYYNEFMKLNEKRLRGKEELRLGVKYVLPPLKKGTSASVSPKAVAGKKRVVRERLFGKKLADVPVTSNRLQGACFYVVSGHGGPDPGAIGKIGKVELHEDEYAYDVALRLAPCHRIQSFPAFVQERSQILFRLLGAIMRLAQQSCRTTGTEFPLTRTHADTCAAAQVYQVVHIKFVHGIVHFTYGHILTFANQAVIVLAFRCNPGSHFTVTAYRRTFRLFRHHLLTSRTVLFHARTGKGFVHCNARLVDAKLLASRGGRLGRSFGCPAVPQKLSRPIIDAIKGGSVMYIYAEAPDYLAHSSVLKKTTGL